MKPTIYHFDDNISQHELLLEKLQDRFNLIPGTDPLLALGQIKDATFAAIVSDFNMLSMDGIKFHEMLKNNQLDQIPFFFFSSDTSKESKINGLKIGAVDYLSPSMCSEELYLRISNRINETTLSYADLSINIKKLQAYKKEAHLELTQTEFKLLFLLIKSKNEILKRETIKEFIWPNSVVLDKTINSHLSNLRLKIEDDTIKIVSIKSSGIQLSQIQSAS